AAGLLVLDWIQNRRRPSRVEAPSTVRRPDPVDEPEQPFVAPLPSAPPPPVAVTPREFPEESFPDAFEESFKDFDSTPKVGATPFGSYHDEPPEPPEVPEPVTAVHEPVTAIQAPAVDPDSEPGEENTDATDVLTVSELSDEVVVIDERPRYHLTTCAWLNNRPTLSLPISEARDLGFTPCALCAPDSTVAARQRARS
ncbi:MAG: hypothetical protein ABW224_09965, partial [Kibdelosporangium sp.]